MSSFLLGTGVVDPAKHFYKRKGNTGMLFVVLPVPVRLSFISFYMVHSSGENGNPRSKLQE